MATDHATLLNAVYSRDLESVKKILGRSDVDIDYLDQDVTPLWLAVYCGQTDISLVDGAANTPLHLAAFKGNDEMVQKLISLGAAVNAVNSDGSTPLEFAYLKKNRTTIALLTKHGATTFLGQSLIDEKFTKFLEYYRKMPAVEYSQITLNTITNDLENGLCYGYAKMHNYKCDLSAADKFKHQVEAIAAWDERIESLQSDPLLLSAFTQVLFSTHFLQCSNPLFKTTDHPPGEDALKQVAASDKPVFTFGFVFKYDELKELLPVLLREGVTVDVSIALHNKMHAITMKKISSDLYELYDSNRDVSKATIFDSLSGLINRLRGAADANSATIGLGLQVSLPSPTVNDIKTYADMHAQCEALVRKRIADNEVDLSDKNKLTTLFYSLAIGDFSTATLLSQHNPSLAGHASHAPLLIIAAQFGAEDMVTWLLKKGADVNVKNPDGATPLTAAVSNNKISTVKLLLKEKPIIDQTYKGGITALFIACQNGNIEIAQALIDEKADMNIIADNGLTPLQIAIMHNRLEIVKLLHQSGADINKASKQGLTPLAFAIKTGSLAIVKYLVEAGTSLKNVILHCSALDIAKTTNFQEIIDYLNVRQNFNVAMANSTIPFFNQASRPRENTFVSETPKL